MRARALSTSHYLYWVLRRRLSLPKMMLLLPRRLCVSQRRLSSSLNCYQSRHILLTIGRGYRVDHGRNRLSAVWTPTGGLTAGQDEGANDKLVRAGFLRQSHSGIFHVLPLGRRVQAKLESLIDHYMKQLGASKVALSTITSKELWLKSGRFDQLESELFAFEDRKGSEYMLSPTHEEEITSLVASSVKSYKDLPLRLYQITRKFRDELRPRHGLLRTREFTMKDLYTFDVSHEAALETYSNVQTIYAALFDALKLPIMVAQASSGDMGGDLSHEYHLPTPVGEDTIIACNSCAYAANAEVAQSRPRLVCDEARSGDQITAASAGREKLGVWRGISKDRLTLVNVWFPERIQCGSNMTEPRQGLVSIPAIQSIVPDLDTSIDNALPLWADAATATVVEGQGGSRQLKLVNLVDVRLESVQDIFVQHENMVWPLSQPGERKPQLNSLTVTHSAIGEGLNLLAARTGDACPCCKDGVLTLKRALEVGHTFHLGSRYSEPLGASITLPIAAKKGEGKSGTAEKTKPMQMGCHGIGVSRLIGAVVEHLADDKGLQWPRAIAPYEVVLVPTTQLTEEGERVYDELALFQTKSESIDAVLDDRRVPFGWKMKDADLVGYPVVVVIGRAWKEAGRCELQCRRLGVKETVALADIRDRILELLRQL